MTGEFDDVYAWVEHGVAKGYCSPAVCSTHDGLPAVGDEDEEWEDGGDPCVPAVRLLHPGETLANDEGPPPATGVGLSVVQG